MMLLKRLLSITALLTLAACGGGGGSSGTPAFGSGASAPLGSGGTGVASDLVLVLSAPTISTSGTETVTATATAIDANRNAVADVPVSIRADNGGVVTPSGATTDASGRVTAVIGVGSDLSARTITVTAVSAGITKTASVVVQAGVTTGGQGSLAIAISNISVNSASPATVTATLKDPQNLPVAGQVVTFKVVRGLAVTNVATALTRSDGTAVAVLSPSNTTGAGADEVTATAALGGSTLTASTGFTVQATNVTLSSFTAAAPSLGAYGQTSLTIGLTGASVGSPVQVSVSSACVAAGRAALSPAKFSATTSTVTLQYRDIGCGALQTADSLQAVIDGSTSVLSLALPISPPFISSLAFISATPETIFLKGSGFTESSSVVFEVRDPNGSPLPNVPVTLKLLTLTGGVTMDSGQSDIVRNSDAQGRVTVRINSGTLPTPVRVSASIGGSNITTVSSNLSVAIGLPSQLNFSLSQATKNIEGYNIDGTANTYQIIAADRSGNPIPNGTSINFVSEGGQIEAIKQTQQVSGIARTVANFVSAEPRPVDGRVTVTVYALGEESFLDVNGNNVRDDGEPFQDLGNVFKDRNFDGYFDIRIDEYIPLSVNNVSACVPVSNNLLALDPSIPSVPGSCDGNWSGAGQVYVRRAAETVLSTSSARPLWLSTAGLDQSCSKIKLQVGPLPVNAADIPVAARLYDVVNGGTWYAGSGGNTLRFIVADANPGRMKPAAQWTNPASFDPLSDYELFPRLNPMAAGTTVSASTPTPGLTVTVGGGTPVPSTLDATTTSVAFEFTDPLKTSGTVLVTFTSPSGVGTTVEVPVRTGTAPTACP